MGKLCIHIDDDAGMSGDESLRLALEALDADVPNTGRTEQQIRESHTPGAE